MTSLSEIFITATNSIARGAVVFAVVRNERFRIEPWLAHYRSMGFGAFAIVDNGSNDGTFEFLSKEKDVVLFRTEESYRLANSGIEWVNEFHARLDPGHWVLLADADELLVYRGWPRTSIFEFTDQVRQAGSNAVFGFMLDMYPEGPVDSADGQDLFEKAPCFDSDYYFRSRPKKPWADQADCIELVGGPRVRLLSSLEKERRTTWVHYFLRGQMDRILPLLPDGLVGLAVRLAPKQMPCLSKVPLAFSGSGFRYVNAHGGSPANFYSENVVFCHFKFLPDFAARVEQEVHSKRAFQARRRIYHVFEGVRQGWSA